MEDVAEGADSGFLTTKRLVPFQSEGVARAYLADGHMLCWDTGMGKSVGGVALIKLLFEDDLIDHVLIVCERNKLREWVDDVEADTLLHVRRHHGTGRQKRLDARGVGHVLVTTYETAKADCAVRKGPRSFEPGPLLRLLVGKRVLIIYDESTKLRNRSSGNYKAHEFLLRTLRKARGGSLKVLALTGTPLEKDYEDGFNQLRLVVPDYMPLVKEFEESYIRYRDPFDRPIYDRFKIMEFMERTRPHITRKRKTDPDVIEQFPPLVEEYRYVEMPAAQRTFYRMAEQLVFEHQDPSGKGDMGAWMLLRQIAGHPASILRSAEKENGSELAKEIVEALGAEHIARLPSGKAEELKRYLDLVVTDQNAKIVVFTFFGQSVLADLEIMLRGEGFPVFPYHGGQSAHENEVSKQLFKEHQTGAVLLASDAGARGINLPEATYVCVAADTPVLTNDLRWVPAGALQAGDGVLGCDEHPTGKGRAGARRWQLGTVVQNTVQPRECLRVNLANGESLVVTPEHRMLIRGGQGVRWERADKLKPCHKLLRYYDVWEPETSFDAGWLSGIFDGEGWFCRQERGTALAVAQNPGLVLDKIRGLVTEAKFQVREHGSPESPIRRFHITGGRSEQTRFLGTYRPIRLIDKWRKLIPNYLAAAIKHVPVLSVEPAGVHDVAIMETSTKTFVGGGYMHHNCEYESALTHAMRIQRRDRIHRINSALGPVTSMTFIAEGTIEEQIFGSVLKRNEKHDIFAGDLDAGEEFVSASDRRIILACAHQRYLDARK